MWSALASGDYREDSALAVIRDSLMTIVVGLGLALVVVTGFSACGADTEEAINISCCSKACVNSGSAMLTYSKLQGCVCGPRHDFVPMKSNGGP